MKNQHLCFFVFAVFSLKSPVAWSVDLPRNNPAAPCGTEFENPPSTMDEDTLITFASEVEDWAQAHQQQNPSHELKDRISDFQENIESLLGEPVSLDDFFKQQEIFEELKSLINGIPNGRDSGNTSDPSLRERIPSQAELLENPSLVKPGQTYIFETQDGDKIPVVFHRQIVREIFSKRKVKNGVAKALLDTLIQNRNIKLKQPVSGGLKKGRLIELIIRNGKKRGSLHNILIGGLLFEDPLYPDHRTWHIVYTAERKHGRQKWAFYTELTRRCEQFLNLLGHEIHSDGFRATH